MANEAELISNPANTPAAVSTGYQAQNTRALAVSNGIDLSTLEITGGTEVTLKAGGGVDVNGSIYALVSDTVLSLSAYGRYFIYLVGSGTNLTPTLSTDDGDFDPALNARYNSSSERILNWVINYSVAGGLQIDKLLTPAQGRNVLIENDVQPETLITTSQTWVVPRTKYYKFKLQGKGGNGGSATSAGIKTGGNGGGGGYGEVRLFLTAGTEVVFVFSTGSGALTQFQIGATVYSVQNGANGTSDTGVSGAGGSSISNFSIAIPGETPANMDSASNRHSKGGDSFLGKGGNNRIAVYTGSLTSSSANGNGSAGTGYGSGGGGAHRYDGGNRTGGTGAPAICIIVG
jgi:hypothetical protein